MPLRCGIVGLPNVGKSSLFNALTSAQAQSENYPFCTIDPNIGIVDVPDPRLGQLASIVKPKRVIPTTIEFVDIAGLVAGASDGQGLGNKFLANIRETDAIIHVVRCFSDEKVIHVAGQVDPIRDIEIINTELALADLTTIENAIIKNQKIANVGDKSSKILLGVLNKLLPELNQGKPIRNVNLADEEKQLIKPYSLLTLKPMLYLANVGEDGLENNQWFNQIRNFAQTENSKALSLCSVLEASLFDLEAYEKTEFLKEFGLNEPGLNRLSQMAYKLLSLENFFTAGEKEVHAWSFIKGSTADQCAGIIHSDFQKGFIRAEVISFNDYIVFLGENRAQAAGKMRLEGKNYLVQDGDVIHFRFNI